MRSRLLSLVAPLLVASSLLLAGTRAGAQSTTTTVSTVTTTTTSTTSPPAPGTTTIPPPTTLTTSSSKPAPAPPTAGGDEAVNGPIVLPPELQAMVNAVRRTRPNDDSRLLDVVRAYASSAHLSLDQAMVLGLGHFPVAGPAHWVHDWLLPRRGPRSICTRAPTSGHPWAHRSGRRTRGGCATRTGASAASPPTSPSPTAPTTTSRTWPAPRRAWRRARSSPRARSSASSATRATRAVGPRISTSRSTRGGAAVDPKPMLDRWVDEAIVYAYALATNPTATTAPEPTAAAPGAQPSTPTSTVPPRTARAARAASINSRGGIAGQIFVIGSLLALCGGRLMRRVRAKIASSPDDE